MAIPVLSMPPPEAALIDKETSKFTRDGYDFLKRLEVVLRALATAPPPSFAPTDAQYVAMALNGTLSAERVLAVGGSLALADGGANGNATLTRAALSGDVTASADSNTVRIDKASEVFSLTGIISPAQITADQNDYSPSGIATANVLRLSSDATRNITGINASSNTNGRLLQIFNLNAVGGGLNIVLVGESASSAAANRFIAGVTITPGGGRTLWYDGTTQRWRFLV